MKKRGDKRVLIVETGSVLDEGIKSLLAREPELMISTVTNVDLNELLKDPLSTHDIIVLCEASSLDRIRTSELLRRISPQKNSRVIIIRLEDNVLEVYDKQCLKVARNNDLITLIKHYQRGIWAFDK